MQVDAQQTSLAQTGEEVYFGGIDVGSLSADAAIIDGQGRLVAHAVVPTGADSQKAGAIAFEQALQRAGLRAEDVAEVLATGYSRSRVREARGAKTEITCHARGAAAAFPDVGTVIDIGGQDSKAIRVADRGRVLDFAMNDKCAAGTGRFLEVMAGILEVSLSDLGSLAARSTTRVTISSTCTVFGESEVVGLVSRGTDPADIAAAVARAIAHRVAGLVRGVGIAGRVVMTGGVALNPSVVQALSETLECPISVPENPQIAGALGAALLALDARLSAAATSAGAEAAPTSAST